MENNREKRTWTVASVKRLLFLNDFDLVINGIFDTASEHIFLLYGGFSGFECFYHKLHFGFVVARYIGFFAFVEEYGFFAYFLKHFFVGYAYFGIRAHRGVARIGHIKSFPYGNRVFPKNIEAF